MTGITLPQAELIADAAAGRVWRHNGLSYATGTHSDRDVTRRILPLARLGLLTLDDGQRWRATPDGRWAAQCALGDLENRIRIIRSMLDREGTR